MAKKKITLEELARMSQDQFSEIQGDIRLIRDSMATTEGLAALRDQMATKDDLSALRHEMHEGFENVIDKVRDELHKVNHAVEIDGLHRRVKRIEEKLGIR